MASPRPAQLRCTRVVRSFLGALACASALLLALPAAAIPVGYHFHARVDSIADPGGVLAGSGLAVGSNVTGLYTVESTTLDLEPAPQVGQYEGMVSQVRP